MANESKVIAFNNFYQQAKELYAVKDYKNSRNMFIKTASLANEISVESNSYNVKMEYHNLADSILKFLKSDFGKVKKEVIIKNEESKKFNSEDINEEDKITFDDVAGLNDVKDEIRFNVIEPLKNPEFAKTYNIKPGAKILLYGPPGTGKTFIARAIAGEIDAKFFNVNCQDLISKYLGDSSVNINGLFEEAYSHKRSIIFFDEFDSVASKREDGNNADQEMNRFVATFLTKVDGFKKPKDVEMTLLIAATNRPWAIDSAMLRGGRFDTHIYVGLPDYEARLFLIKKVFKNIPIDNDVDLNELANHLEGYGGGDITAICNKIISQTYRKAIKNQKIINISNDDIYNVVSQSKKNVTKDELDKFDKFKNR